MNSIVRKVGLSCGWAALFVLVGVTGCKSPDFTYSDPTANGGAGAGGAPEDQIVDSPDLLRPGDRIEIGFSGNPNAPGMAHREQIRDDGYVQPPLLGTNVVAAGKTVGQLQTQLHGFYVPAYFKNLTVTVRLEDRYFFVGGQVRAPGQKLYLAEMTVTKAVQAAGDFTDFANRRKVEVTRRDGSRIVVDCRRALRRSQEDPPIYPGDKVHVPQRW